MILSTFSFRSINGSKSCNWSYREEDAQGFGRNFGGSLALTSDQLTALEALGTAGVDLVVANVTSIVLNGEITDGTDPLSGRGAVSTVRKDNTTFRKSDPLTVSIEGALAAAIRASYTAKLAAEIAKAEAP